MSAEPAGNPFDKLFSSPEAGERNQHHFTIKQIMMNIAKNPDGSLSRKDIFGGAHAFRMLGKIAGELLEQMRKKLDKDIAHQRMMAASYKMGLELGVMHKIADDSIKQIDDILASMEPKENFKTPRNKLNKDKDTFEDYKTQIDFIDAARMAADPEDFEAVQTRFELLRERFMDYLKSFKDRSTKSAFNTETNYLEDVEISNDLAGEEGQSILDRFHALFFGKASNDEHYGGTATDDPAPAL